MELFSTYYRKFVPDMGEPVQISNGRPRFRTGYLLKYKIDLLCPRWSLVSGNVPVDEFRRVYWSDLDKLGVEKIRAAFDTVADLSGQDKLVLMCFEKEVSDCHRGDFAMWWKQATGEKITEL